MKVCNRCGTEIYTRDGNNRCDKCSGKVTKAKTARIAREIALKSIGLTKVRGALGGTYWE